MVINRIKKNKIFLKITLKFSKIIFMALLVTQKLNQELQSNFRQNKTSFPILFQVIIPQHLFYCQMGKLIFLFLIS